jgi:hypothetical protein
MAVNNLNTPGVGIQPSLIDAKGDLLVGTADDAIDRLGVTGTTGAVLTADAGETTGLKWAAAGSVGGLVHIETQTFSAVSAVSFSNDVFSSTYDNYRIVFHKTSSSSTGNFEFRMRASGTDANAGEYNFTQIGLEINTAQNRTGISATSGSFGEFVSGVSSYSIEVYSPFLTRHTELSSFGGRSSRRVLSTYNTHGNSGSFDSITLIASSGNMTGSTSVYGYRK